MRDETRSRVWHHEGAFVTIRSGVAFVDVRKEGYETRLYGSLLLLYRAIARLGGRNFPDVDFGITPGDYPRADASFNYNRLVNSTPPEPWIWPDFFFMGWPEIGAPPWAVLFDTIMKRTRELPFRDRINKMFWRGNGGLDKTLRGKLVGKLHPRTDIADVSYIPGFNILHDKLADDPKFNISTLITKLEDFCRYKYIIYTEGKSYSGRLKAHLLCGSVILSHTRKWESYESGLMQEGVHVLSTDNDWSTMEEIYNKLEGNQTLAEKIAAENVKLRQMLEEDAISCYLLESLKCYKDVARYNLTRTEHRAPLEHFILAKMKPSTYFRGIAMG